MVEDGEHEPAIGDVLGDGPAETERRAPHVEPRIEYGAAHLDAD